MLNFNCKVNFADSTIIQITLIYLNIGTPKNSYFPFETNGKLMVRDIPILTCIKGINSLALEILILHMCILEIALQKNDPSFDEYL